MITIGELIGEVFPADAALLTSDAHLGREVTWATRPRPSPPAFGHLSGGELVLLRARDLSDVDERLTVAGAVRQLAEFAVSAVAVAGAVPADAVTIATDRKVTLIQLAEELDLGEIERAASHLIAERRRERQRRGAETGRRLIELAIAGEPLSAVISTLAQLSRQAVALEGRDGRLLTYHSTAGAAKRDEVAPLLSANRETLRNWLAVTSDASPAEPPTMRLALGTELDRTVAPVIGRDGLLGCLSLIGPVSGWSGDDALFASRGAAACAIVLAREYASIAARREVELTVLDEILDSALRNELSLLQQAKRLGHDLTAGHRVIVLRPAEAPTDGAREAVSAALAQIDSTLLWRARDGAYEIVLDEATPPEAVASLIKRTVGSERLAAGTGTVRAGLAGLQRSHQEARQALSIGERLGVSDTISYFPELGIYRFLFATEALPEFDEFHAATLGSLIDHDEQHRADLVETLRAWFDANSSPKEASERLGVHRNTILYRLERIATVTGYDLANAETRLRLQLALAMHTIRRSRVSEQVDVRKLEAMGSG